MGLQKHHIKELLPIVIACAVWGLLWSNQQVQVLCDNMAVVDILKTKSSKATGVVEMPVFMAIYNITGILNTAVDAISQNNIQVIRQVVPAAEWMPDSVSLELWDLLVSDLMSVAWKQLLKNCELSTMFG